MISLTNFVNLVYFDKIKIFTLNFHVAWSYRWLFKLLDAEMLYYLLGGSCVLRLMFSVLMYVFGNDGDNNCVQICNIRATWSVNFMY